MVLTTSRREPKPVLYHQDMEWAPLDLMQAGGGLVAIQRKNNNDVTLSSEERAWLLGCLALLSIEVKDLPKWRRGDSVKHRLNRALVEGDRKEQIAVLERILADLKAEK
ncbi:MAG: hypothetical protein QOD77_639 [Thermoplasmata archaeon]|nr:hypothetical protein [Thermoplasmata archaeon]